MTDGDPDTLRDWSSQQQRVSVPRPGLLVVFSSVPGLAGATFTLPRSLVIGRGQLADDRRSLADGRISTRHLELVREGARVEGHDLGARNGCFLNGKQVREFGLSPRDLLRIGGTLFQLLLDLRVIAEPEPDDAVAEELPGPSPELREVRNQLRSLARLEAEVLVLGPSGVGKERVARALHRARKPGGPLVTLNCAVLTEELAASELFGHVRGAFTGASEARLGAFRQADGGTLLLDEIAELPRSLQPKFLRALQEGRFQPVGSDREVEVRTRVISATNQDILALVRAERFRPDLYSRLAGAVLTIPPLSARPSDIAFLAQRFLGEDRLLHPLAVEELLLHPWPHNVRDLMAVVNLLGDQAASPVPLNHAAREKMRADLTLVASSGEGSEPEEKPTWPESPEARRRLLSELLERCDGNVSQTARILGKRLTSVRRWISLYGIDPRKHRG